MENDLTPKEVAFSLGTSTETLRQWRLKKMGPAFYLLPSGRPRYPRRSLEEFKKARIEKAAA